jgi:hypothetical protein
MLKGATWGEGRLLGSRNVTRFSPARSTCNLPKRTWKGDDERVTSPSWFGEYSVAWWDSPCRHGG